MNDIIIKKTSEQIEGIRESCVLAASTLNHLIPLVSEGITTDYLNLEAETFIRDHNAEPAPLNYLGYPKATCISLNEVVCHGVPNSDCLKQGDVLNIDVTTILNGYYGDCSRMFSVGEVSNESRQLCQATYGLLWKSIGCVKPGAKFSDIGKSIEEGIEILELPYTIVDRFCGHGVGLAFHEYPQIAHFNNDENREMQPGMTFTIEPMINAGQRDVLIDESDKWTARTADGSLSAQYEHTILVTDDGYEVLTMLWDKGWGSVL